MKLTAPKIMHSDDFLSYPGMQRAENGYKLSFLCSEESAVLKIFELTDEENSFSYTLDSSYKHGNVFSAVVVGDVSGLAFSINEKPYPYAHSYEYLCEGEDYFGTVRENLVSVFPSAAAKDFDFEDDMPVKIPTSDLIIYKLHVRGFSKRDGSGSFLEIAEKIHHFKELGINAVLLMPCYDFHEVRPASETYGNRYLGGGLINYWGYTDGYYFSPKRAYAKADAQLEFKMLVKALHSAGIKVLTEFLFPYDMSPLQAVSILRTWSCEYHVDGFRVMAGDKTYSAIMSDPYMSDLVILSDANDLQSYYEGYGERFFREEGTVIRYDGFFRDSVKRFFRGEEDSLFGFMDALTRKYHGHPAINFLADHEGMTLMDSVSYERKHNESNCERNHDGIRNNYCRNFGVEGATDDDKINNMRHSMIKNYLTALFMGHGIPLIMAGDEFGRTQSGNNNPYCHDDEINYVDWSLKDRCTDIFEYTKRLIDIRKELGFIHPSCDFSFTDHRNKGLPDVSYHGEQAWYPEMESYTKNIGILYCGAYGGSNRNIYVVYNMHDREQSFAIPGHIGKDWSVLAATDEAVILKEERCVRLKAYSCAILDSGE